MDKTPQPLRTTASPTEQGSSRLTARLRLRGLAALAPAGALFVTLGFLAPAGASATGSVVITRYAGISGSQASPTPGPATSSHLSYPQGVAVDSSGDLYVADPAANVIEKVTPSGTLSIVAGNGTGGAATAGPALSSKLNNPQQLAVDSSGNLYIADDNNNTVDKVTPTGTLSIFAGTGTAGTVTPGPASSSKLSNPIGVAVDSNGNVFIGEQGNNEVDKVTPSGTLSVFKTGFSSPSDIAIDASNNLYVADDAHQEIAKVTPSGTLSIVAGTGLIGFPTAGLATSSRLDYPAGVAVDASGNVYIDDTTAYDLLEVTPGGTLSVVAGNNMNISAPTYGGSPSSSALVSPYGVAVDSSGVVYVADGSNRTVDRIGPTTPAPPTIIGATPSTTSIAVSFDPPVSDGTSPITGYEASTDGGSTWHGITTTSGSSTSLQATLSGLTAGSAYSVLVRADNGSGSGTDSSTSSVTLPVPTTTTTSTSSTASTATTTTTVAATTSTTTASLPAPNSTFTAQHVPYVNTTTGAVMVYDTVQTPGTLTWTALYRNGALGVVATTATACPAFQEILTGRCRTDWLVFGQGSSTAESAGIMPVAISPDLVARNLLRRARREHRHGVRLAIVVTFQSAYGGPPVTHIVTVLATLHPHGVVTTRSTS